MLIIVFLGGLLIGSFLNVCIYRIPRQESTVFPASHCTSCGASIKPYDLIPVVSFLLLKGKCRNCADSISIRYPLVELTTAALITLQAWKWGLSLQLIFFTVMTSVLIVITMIDLDQQLIPDGLILIIAAAGVLYLLAVQVPRFGMMNLLDNVIGFAVGGGVFFFISVVSKGGMGGGDIKLMAVLGLWFGWEKLLFLMLCSFVGGAFISILLLILKRKGRKDAIPFGPFIALAAYFTSLYGAEIIQWYLRPFI